MTHVLLRCPCLAGTRLRLFGTLHPDQLRDGGAVAALAHGYLLHREALGYGRPVESKQQQQQQHVRLLLPLPLEAPLSVE